MATGYTLEIGYVSGYSSNLTRDQRWKEFENYARQLIETPAMLVDESNRLMIYHMHTLGIDVDITVA